MIGQIKLSELTSESIMDDDIFMTLMSMDSPVQRKRLEQHLINRAKELGKKTDFVELLKAYKEEYMTQKVEKEKRAQTNDNVTRFDEYEALHCGNWFADMTGVRTFSLNESEVLACYHPITIVTKYNNAETDMEKVELAYKRGTKWKRIVVAKNQIASASKIVGLSDYGVAVTSETAKNLVRYLYDLENLNILSIPTQISTQKMGWVKGKFMPYTDDIKFDSEERFKAAYESIKSQGDYLEWLDVVKEVRQSDRFEPKIYLAASFASVLVEPLGALPFIVNLWGETGKGKTVALMLAASVWAEPSHDFMADAKATLTSMELRLDFLNSLPFCLDDMSQVKERFKGDDFSEFIYSVCSGKGKDRANTQLGLNRMTKWKNCILTNMERPLASETMQGGAVNRIIDVEMKEGSLFEDGNKTVEVLRKNYGWSGQYFIKAIELLGEKAIKDMQKANFARIKKKLDDMGIEREEKQILPMSIILTADQIAAQYVFADDYCLDLEQCINCLKSKEEVSENIRAYEFIMSEVAVHENRFQYENGTKDDNYHGEIWGYIRSGMVYIYSNVFNSMCERGNFSRKAFLTWANNRKLLKTDLPDKNGRIRYTVKVCGNRCVCIQRTYDPNKHDKFVEADMQQIPFTTK